MPVPLPLTSERLERHGLFLIEDGQTMFLWVGRDAVPQLVMDVFNLPSYEALRGGKVRLFKYIRDRSLTPSIRRRHYRCWIIHSINVSMQLYRSRGRCVAVSITHNYTL